MFVPSFTTPVEMYTPPPGYGVLGVGYKGTAPNAAPFLYGSALYRILQTAGIFPSPGQIWMMQSIDEGATWSILDFSHSPIVAAPPQNAATGGYVFDGKHTLFLAYQTTGLLVAGAIQLQNFDLATGLWGSAYGAASAPLCNVVNQLFLRSDGSLLCIFNRTLSGGNVVGLSAAAFAAGAWGARFNIDVKLTPGLTSNSASAAVYDPASGTVHLFGGAWDGLQTNFYPFYQQVFLNDALGSFTQFAATQAAAGEWDTFFNLNNPIIVNNSILWGVAVVTAFGDDYATVLVGTPLSAPAFQVIPPPGVDPSGPLPSSAQGYAPALFFDGAIVWGVYCSVGAANSLRLVQTQNLANVALGWSGATIYDDATGPVPLAAEQFPTITVANFRIVVTVGGSDYLDGGGLTEFFLSGAGPYVIGVQVMLRGVRRYRSEVGSEKLVEAPEVPHVDKAV